jgi:GNAT superfamily N-acetyltransferase
MPRVRTTDASEAAELLAGGARLMREGSDMVLDLAPDGLAPAAPSLPAGVHAIGAAEAASRLPAASLLAYGPGHPDNPGSLAEAERRWRQLMTGEAVGPVLEPPSIAIEDLAGEVLGAVVVTRLWPESWGWAGGPWVADIFVVPAHQGRGLGRALLTHAVAWAHAHAEPRIGLTVTAGNPAQRLYESAGFQRRRTIFVLETS